MYLEIFLADFAVFRGFLGISRDFAEIPKSRGSATARNIRSPVDRSYLCISKFNSFSMCGRASSVTRLQSRAWSFSCLARFPRRNKKKGRLLIV